MARIKMDVQRKTGINENNETWVVLGNTYEIKDKLKEAGAVFNKLLNWHFDHEPKGLNYPYIKVNMLDDDWSEVINKANEALLPKCKSEFVGEVGDTVEVYCVFVKKATYSTKFGTMFVYTFEDEDENLFVWKTTTYFLDSANLEDTVILKGTVKEHAKYKNQKQTILTRCKVKTF